MFRLRYLFIVGPLALVSASIAMGQSTSSVEEQFAGYQQQLSVTADNLLAAPKPNMGEAGRSGAPQTSRAKNNAVNFNNALSRVQQLRLLLEPILREQGVPTDLAAVVLVESGGRPTALSPKGALGLWQLMPETARRYGLTVTPGRDERADLTKATQAAARYLRDLHAEFGDWQLAFAAYNAGEQAVHQAMLRTGSSEFTGLSALLPSETRAYVPAVMTALPLFGRAKEYSVATLQTARRAHVLYASAQLEN
jgi:soluble lytic murein transglycosylase-like protein